jgi:hypothetical protein
MEVEVKVKESIYGYPVGEFVVCQRIRCVFLAVLFRDDVILGEEVFLALAIFRCAIYFAVFALPNDKLKCVSI